MARWARKSFMAEFDFIDITSAIEIKDRRKLRSHQTDAVVDHFSFSLLQAPSGLSAWDQLKSARDGRGVVDGIAVTVRSQKSLPLNPAIFFASDESLLSIPRIVQPWLRAVRARPRAFLRNSASLELASSPSL
jgi:hypothetical protein